jgi:hypothetical protein
MLLCPLTNRANLAGIEILGVTPATAFHLARREPLEVGLYVAIGSQIAGLYKRDKWIVTDLHQPRRL